MASNNKKMLEQWNLKRAAPARTQIHAKCFVDLRHMLNAARATVTSYCRSRTPDLAVVIDLRVELRTENVGCSNFTLALQEKTRLGLFICGGKPFMGSLHFASLGAHGFGL